MCTPACSFRFFQNFDSLNEINLSKNSLLQAQVDNMLNETCCSMDRKKRRITVRFAICLALAFCVSMLTLQKEFESLPRSLTSDVSSHIRADNKSSSNIPENTTTTMDDTMSTPTDAINVDYPNITAREIKIEDSTGSDNSLLWPPTELIDSLLSRDSTMSASHTKDGNIPRLIVAASNAEYVDFADNFANSLLMLNITNFVFVPLDTQAHDLLLEAYPDHTLPMMPGVASPSGKADFGSEEFKLLTASRPTFLKAFLLGGYAVFYNDIDIVWRKNAWDVIDERGAEVHDSEINVTTIESMMWMDGIENESDVCTCLLYLLPTDNSISLMEKWEEAINTDNYRHDQTAFTDVARQLEFPIGGGRKDGTKIFPTDDQFPFAPSYNWHIDSNDKNPDETVLVHNNWIIGKQSKRDRFNTAGLWKPSGRLLGSEYQ